MPLSGRGVPVDQEDRTVRFSGFQTTGPSLPGDHCRLLKEHLQACEAAMADEVAVREAERRVAATRTEHSAVRDVPSWHTWRTAISDLDLASARLSMSERRVRETWVAYLRAVVGQ